MGSCLAVMPFLEQKISGNAVNRQIRSIVHMLQCSSNLHGQFVVATFKFLLCPLGVMIGLEFSSYQVDEDAGSVLVCATVQGSISETAALGVFLRTIIDGSKRAINFVPASWRHGCIMHGYETLAYEA